MSVLFETDAGILLLEIIIPAAIITTIGEVTERRAMRREGKDD